MPSPNVLGTLLRLLGVVGLGVVGALLGTFLAEPTASTGLPLLVIVAVTGGSL